VRNQFFELDFAQMQQGGFRVGGLLAFGLARRGLNARWRGNAVQRRQFFGRKAQRDAPRLAGHARD
jgi:hypothetical protein